MQVGLPWQCRRRPTVQCCPLQYMLLRRHWRVLLWSVCCARATSASAADAAARAAAPGAPVDSIATFKFGISITETHDGLPWAGPPHPASVKNALHYLQSRVNNAADPFRMINGAAIQLEASRPPGYGEGPYPDDGGNVATVAEIYSWFAGFGAVDVLFCPSDWRLANTAANAAKSAAAVWICWASDEAIFFQPPLGQGADGLLPRGVLRLAASLMAAKLSGQRADWTPSEYPLSSDLEFAGWVPRGLGIRSNTFGSKIGGIADVVPSGRAFDINVPKHRRWSNALALVRAQGGQAAVILFGAGFAEDANTAADDAATLNYSSVTLVDLGISGTQHQFYSKSAQLASVLPDVVLVMADELTTVFTLLKLKAYRVTPKSLAISSFDGHLIDALDGFLVSQLLTPMPWAPPVGPRSTDVFGSFDDFNATYMSTYFDETELDYLVPNMSHASTTSQWRSLFIRAYMVAPPMGAIQMATAGELYISALMQAANSTPVSVAQALRRQHGYATLMGSIGFDDRGLRLNRAPNCDAVLTAQYRPLNTSLEPLAYLDTTQVVLAHQSSNETDDGTRIAFPMQKWWKKQGDLYPCAAGCQWTQLKCQECPPGKFRGGERDSHCRTCEPGHFMNETGASACMTCPKAGADCSNRMLPVAQPGWFRITLALPAGSADRNRSAELRSIKDCHRPKSERYSHRMFPCISAEVCPFGDECGGFNRGLLCAQCQEGYSFQNSFNGNPAKRVCMACPPLSSTIAYLALLMFAYWLLIYFLQRGARSATLCVNSRTCATLRTLIHNLQILACVFEATGLDVQSIVIPFLVPLNWLYRPLDIVGWDCGVAAVMRVLFPNRIDTDDLLGKLLTSCLCIPIGIGIVLLIHVLQYMLHVLFLTYPIKDYQRRAMRKFRRILGIAALWDRRYVKVTSSAVQEVVLLAELQNYRWIVAKPDLSLGVINLANKGTVKSSPTGFGDEHEVRLSKLPRLTHGMRSRLLGAADGLAATGVKEATMTKDGNPADAAAIAGTNHAKDVERLEYITSDEESVSFSGDSDSDSWDEVELDSEDARRREENLEESEEPPFLLPHFGPRVGRGPADAAYRADDSASASKEDFAKVRGHMQAPDQPGPRLACAGAAARKKTPDVAPKIQTATADEWPTLLGRPQASKSSSDAEYGSVLSHQWSARAPQEMDQRTSSSSAKKDSTGPVVKSGSIDRMSTDSKSQKRRLYRGVSASDSCRAQGSQGSLRTSKSRMSKTRTNYHLTSGPGAKSNRLHIWRHLCAQRMDLWRHVIAVTMVVYAPVLRGVAQGFMCTDLLSQGVLQGLTRQEQSYFSRLAVDYDFTCDDPRVSNTKGLARWIFAILLWVLPLSTIAMALLVRAELLVPHVRRSFSILYVGFKHKLCWWEGVRMLRMASLIGAAAAFGERETRTRVLLGTLLVFMILHVLAKPYATLDRFYLAKLDFLGLAGAVSVVVAGAVVLHPQDPERAKVFVPALGPRRTHLAAILLVVMFNVGVFLYGLFGIVLSEPVMTTLLVEQSGGVLGKKTRRFMAALRWIWALNEVKVATDRKGTVFVDAQRLNQREKHFLEKSMESLLHCCVSSSSQFHPGSLVVAFHEGFQKAVRARSALMRARSQTLGSGHVPLLACSCVSLGSVHQDPPDLNPVQDTGGVTVEELGDTFEVVRNDICMNSPSLQDRIKSAREGTIHEYQAPELKEWRVGESYTQFIMEMSATGRCAIDGEPLQFCAPYAHEFKPLRTSSRWMCMQLRITSDGMYCGCLQLKPSDEAESAVPHFDSETFSEVSAFRCSICGIEVCEPCKLKFDTGKSKASAQWVDQYVQQSWDDEFVQVQAMDVDELEVALASEIAETQRLEKLLEEVARESKRCEGQIAPS